MKFHNGFKDIKVKLVNFKGNDLARMVYKAGRLSHDFNRTLSETYSPDNEDCKDLIYKIINGTTLPKNALEGHRFTFQIEGISRICLAQLTRDTAIFASQGGGVYPLSQDFVLPMSIANDKEIMKKLELAQWYLEEAYILAAEKEIPALEARYIGLHCQTISLTASYTPKDFVRSCFSRTSSNFCDECNYIYRLMYWELSKAIHKLKDPLSVELWQWLVNERNCINDGIYIRERLYNSDFTTTGMPVYGSPHKDANAINDWRKSGWKMELERIYKKKPHLLTLNEHNIIRNWMQREAKGETLPTTYDSKSPDSLCNAVKRTDWYGEHRH